MGEEGDFDVTPAEIDIRMVAFGFGDGADFIYKRERLGKILEFEIAENFVVIRHGPIWRVRHKCLNIGGGEFSFAQLASFAFFVGQIFHKYIVSKFAKEKPVHSHGRLYLIEGS